ncbi:LysR substrate-binding domain-containing protein, partial [Paraburkholderia fungorum]|uniref:LysR substrate-binding domain-containing protein n=1 Tax=Paraburkholderia fungorum TaxID=134537 RepID=UPI00241CC6BE
MIYPWQADDWNRLQQLRGHWPHALLLHGQAGIGKLRFAQHLAQGLLCEAQQANGEPCGTCVACNWFTQGNHPDYRIVVPEALAAVRGGEPAGDFVLGTMYSTAATHLPGLLARYHQAYPAVNLQVRAAPSGELLEGLLNHTLDAALVDGPPSLAGLDGVPLCDEQLVLITSPEHPAVHTAKDVAGK